MSFRESFTREQRKNLLQYDDNAFLFFLITVILCITVPWAIKLIWSSLYPDNKLLKTVDSKGRTKLFCKCDDCTIDLLNKYKTFSNWKNKCSISRLIQFFILIVLFIFVTISIKNLSDESSIQRFDPYEILGIQPNATEKEIKKTFRLLSLIHHPDKNPNDPSAAARFILMKKALSALTDETAKKNMELYGNPDGQGNMEIGIGLPKFLVDENNQSICLSFILTFLLLIIPLLFISRYQKQKLYYSNGVRVETIHFISFYMTENTTSKNLLEFLVLSAEAREFNVRENNMEVFDIIAKKVPQLRKEYRENLNVYKLYLMLQAHINDLHNDITPIMREDLLKFVLLCFPILDCIIEIAIIHTWYTVVQATLALSRCLIHGLPIDCNPYIQVFGEDYKDIEKKLPDSLRDFLLLPQEEKDNILSLFESNKRTQFCKVISSIPLRILNTKIHVWGEKEIVENDVTTITIDIEQLHIPDNCVSAFVHSKYLPNFHNEKLWLFVINMSTGKPLMHKHFIAETRNYSIDLQFIAPPAGTYTFQIVLSSSSYFDVDVIKNYSFTVLNSSKVKRELFVHKKDLELGSEQSIFSQFLKPETTKKNEVSDSEED